MGVQRAAARGGLLKADIAQAFTDDRTAGIVEVVRVKADRAVLRDRIAHDLRAISAVHRNAYCAGPTGAAVVIAAEGDGHHAGKAAGGDKAHIGDAGTVAAVIVGRCRDL